MCLKIDAKYPVLIGAWLGWLSSFRGGGWVGCVSDGFPLVVECDACPLPGVGGQCFTVGDHLWLWPLLFFRVVVGVSFVVLYPMPFGVLIKHLRRV